MIRSYLFSPPLGTEVLTKVHCQKDTTVLNVNFSLLLIVCQSNKYISCCTLGKIFSLNLRALGIFNALILSALKKTCAHDTHTFAL